MTTFCSPNIQYDTVSHDSDTSSNATLKPSHLPRHRLLPADDVTYPMPAWSNTERDLEVGPLTIGSGAYITGPWLTQIGRAHV